MHSSRRTALKVRQATVVLHTDRSAKSRPSATTRRDIKRHFGRALAPGHRQSGKTLAVPIDMSWQFVPTVAIPHVAPVASETQRRAFVHSCVGVVDIG